MSTVTGEFDEVYRATTHDFCLALIRLNAKFLSPNHTKLGVDAPFVCFAMARAKRKITKIRKICPKCRKRVSDYEAHKRKEHLSNISVHYYQHALSEEKAKRAADGHFHCKHCAYSNQSSTAFRSHVKRCRVPLRTNALGTDGDHGSESEMDVDAEFDEYVDGSDEPMERRDGCVEDDDEHVEDDDEHVEDGGWDVGDDDESVEEDSGRNSGNIEAEEETQVMYQEDPRGSAKWSSEYLEGERARALLFPPEDREDSDGESDLENCNENGNQGGTDEESGDSEDDHDAMASSTRRAHGGVGTSLHEADGDTADTGDESGEEVIISGHVLSSRQVPLGPETIQDKKMELLGIAVNPEHKIVICVQCKTTLTPPSLYRHVRLQKPQLHNSLGNFRPGQSLEFASKAYFNNLVKVYGIGDPYKQVPKTRVPAVPGLQIYKNMLCCSKCGKALANRSSFSLSSCCGRGQLVWGPAQTFSNYSRGHYFAIELPVRSKPDSEDRVALFNKQFASNPRKESRICGASNPHEMNLFLKQDNWLREVEGMTGSQTVNISRNALPHLRKAVGDTISRYASKLVLALSSGDASHGLSIGDYNNQGSSASPLKAVTIDTQKAYGTVATRMVLFSLGLASGEFEDYSRQVEQCQKDAAKKFLRALKSGRSKEQDDALQQFLLSLFTQNRGNSSRYTLVIYRFLILYSFCREGNLRKAGCITQYISAIIFFGRGAIYNAIKQEMDRTNQGFHTLHPRFERYLSYRSDYALSPLYLTRNLLKKFAAQQTHSTNLNLIDNLQTVVLKKSSVTLKSIGSMFHALLDDIKNRRKALLGVDIETEIEIPDSLIDEPDNHNPGFYFGDISRNKLKRYEGLLAKVIFGRKALREKYGTVGADKKLTLNRQVCHRFLEEARSIRSALGTLLHICTSGPYRGTEYITTCVRNAANGNVRNVKAILGRLCLVSGYNKSTSATQELKVSYRFIPKCAWSTCIVDFVVFRPFEDILAKQLAIADAEDHRFLDKLFPHLTSPTTSEDVSEALSQDTSKFLGCRIGLRDWRQLTVAFSRAHRDPRAAEIRKISPDNQIRGHPDQMSNENYGNIPEDPAGAGFETLRSHLQTAHWWWHLVDIKSGDLPLTASTVHVNDVFKRLEDTLKKLNYAEDYIRKLEKRFEGLEDNLSTAVAAAVVDALEDPATLKWMTNLEARVRNQMPNPT